MKLLKAKNAKTSMVWVLVLILIVVVILGGATIPRIDFSSWLPNLGGGGQDALANVNKQLKFAVTDKYAGSARASISNGIKVYDGTSLALLETLSTGSDGTVNTAFTYPSGEHLYVLWDDSNNDMWFDLVVPKMNPKDAESATYNNIPLRVFQIGTYTTDLLYVGSTAYADASSYNKTLSGSTPTFSYTLSNSGSDNTGLLESYDPIYKQNWGVYVTVTFSTGDYATVLPYGFDADFTLGLTHYVAKHADANKLTLWKIGNNYVTGYEGTWSMSYTLDLTGYSDTNGNTVMQITVYAKADPSYAQNHGGSYGAGIVTLAEQTVTLRD